MEKTNGNGQKIALGWLFGQPAYIVLLFSILASIGYGAWYGVPAAINQIQDGYEQLESRHAAERKELREDAKTERVETRAAIEGNTEALKTLTEEIKRK